MTLQEIMTKDVATLSPLMEAGMAARFLAERRITGAPVVDQHGMVLGVLSQTDLVRHQGRALPPEGWSSPALDWTDGAEKTPVLDLMTGEAVTCEEDTPLEDVAALMLEKRIHRVLVTRGGRLAGIVTAMDLLRAIPGQQEAR